MEPKKRQVTAKAEYVRKDYFLDKVCKWLEDNLWKYDQGSVIQIDAKDVTDDLRRDMEG